MYRSPECRPRCQHAEGLGATGYNCAEVCELAATTLRTNIVLSDAEFDQLLADMDAPPGKPPSWWR